MRRSHTSRDGELCCSCGSELREKWKFMEIDFVKFLCYKTWTGKLRNEWNYFRKKSCAALYGSFGVGRLCNVPRGERYFTRKAPNANRNRRHVAFTAFYNCALQFFSQQISLSLKKFLSQQNDYKELLISFTIQWVRCASMDSRKTRRKEPILQA